MTRPFTCAVLVLAAITSLSVRAEDEEANTTSSSGPASARPVIAGTVLSPDGAPVPQVMVSLFPVTYAQKRTDAAGRFVLPADTSSTPGQRILIARQPEANLAVALEWTEETTNITLRLAPAIILAGRVLDASGAAVTNAQARVTLTTDDAGPTLGQPTKTGPDGLFEIKALPAGLRYAVLITARGFGPTSAEVNPATGPPGRIELAPIRLVAANQHVAGVVVDAENEPVSGAWVYLRGEQQTPRSKRADAQGHFIIDGLSVGTVRLSANSPTGGFGTAEAQAGDTNVTLRLGVRTVAAEPRGVASLRSKPLPDLTTAGLTPTDLPEGQPALVLLLDAEQRPSRAMLKSLTALGPELKAKAVAVVLVQIGDMTDETFATWKQENPTAFPFVRWNRPPDKGRTDWGATALPWLLLTDKSHKIVADGFALDDLESKLKEL